MSLILLVCVLCVKSGLFLPLSTQRTPRTLLLAGRGVWRRFRLGVDGEADKFSPTSNLLCGKF